VRPMLNLPLSKMEEWSAKLMDGSLLDKDKYVRACMHARSLIFLFLLAPLMLFRSTLLNLQSAALTLCACSSNHDPKCSLPNSAVTCIRILYYCVYLYVTVSSHVPMCTYQCLRVRVCSSSLLLLLWLLLCGGLCVHVHTLPPTPHSPPHIPTHKAGGGGVQSWRALGPTVRVAGPSRRLQRGMRVHTTLGVITDASSCTCTKELQRSACCYVNYLPIN